MYFGTPDFEHGNVIYCCCIVKLFGHVPLHIHYDTNRLFVRWCVSLA